MLGQGGSKASGAARLWTLPFHGGVQVLRTQCPGVTEPPELAFLQIVRTPVTSTSSLLAIFQFP